MNGFWKHLPFSYISRDCSVLCDTYTTLNTKKGTVIDTMTVCDGINQQISELKQKLVHLQAIVDDPTTCQILSTDQCVAFIKTTYRSIGNTEKQIANLQQEVSLLNNCAGRELVRSLNAQWTICTDNLLAHGPWSTPPEGVLLTIDPNGDVTVLESTFLVDGISLQFGPGKGRYDFNSGSLTLDNLPVQAENVPFVGTITTTAHLSTLNSLSPDCNAKPFVGSPASSASDATGSITLVGTASASGANAQLQVKGTLQSSI